MIAIPLRFRVPISAALLLCLMSGACNRRAPSPNAIDPNADRIVTRMTTFLKELKSVQVKVVIKYMVNPGNRKTETLYRYVVSCQRPNKLAIVFEEGPQGKTLVSDGTSMTIYQSQTNSYTVTSAPKTLDNVIMEESGPLVKLGARGPAIFDLLVGNLDRNGLLDETTSGVLSGEESIGNKPCWHLKFEKPRLPWDLWVAKTDDPLPVQIVPDLTIICRERSLVSSRSQPVTMNWSLSFSDWKLNPQLPESVFQFTPPPDAQSASDTDESSGPLTK